MKGLKCLLGLMCLVAAVLVPGCIVVSDDTVPVGVAAVEIATPPPPPPAVIVTRPPPPSGFYVWIDGHYVVRSGAWVWVAGHWERPERRGQVWVPSHVSRRGRHYFWRPGHWR
jgi:WXXGXW repeat (2 copies)